MDEVQAKEDGFNYYGPKPVTVDELPSDTKNIKDNTPFYKKNSAGNEITMYIRNNNKWFSGPTFTEV